MITRIVFYFIPNEFRAQEKYLYQRRGQTRVGTLASLEQAKIQTHPFASPTRLFVMREEPKGTF
jgi:predicted ATPase